MMSEYPPEEQAADSGVRIKCPTCGRTFNEAAMEKHERICAKVFASKRKAFDSKGARAATDGDGKGMEKDPYSMGGGFPGNKASKKKQPTKSTAAQEAKPKGAIPKWKLQSLQFR